MGEGYATRSTNPAKVGCHLGLRRPLPGVKAGEVHTTEYSVTSYILDHPVHGN